MHISWIRERDVNVRPSLLILPVGARNWACNVWQSITMNIIKRPKWSNSDVLLYP